MSHPAFRGHMYEAYQKAGHRQRRRVDRQSTSGPADQTQAALWGEAEQPAVRGEAEQPAVRGEAEQPAVRVEAKQPAGGVPKKCRYKRDPPQEEQQDPEEDQNHRRAQWA
jgi:hypothetical protein